MTHDAERTETGELVGAKVAYEDAVHPSVNWLWLVDLAGAERAVDIARGTSSLGDALSAHFGQVEFVNLDTVLGGPNNGRALHAGSLPLADHACDCVTIQRFLDEFRSRSALDCATRAWLLGEARRILRPNGVLYVGTTNAGIGAHGFSSVLWRRRLSRELRRAGFHGLRRYYAEPNLDTPLAIIPAVRRAVLAYETRQDVVGWRCWVRRAAASVGAYDLLFPSVFTLAWL